jgi:hypothetical protein
MIYMSNTLPTHPAPEQLAAFGLGHCNATTAGMVSSHLEACAECRLVVEQLPDDRLAALVRSAAGLVSAQVSPTRFSESLQSPRRKLRQTFTPRG